jgi:hypothetical protein
MRYRLRTLPQFALSGVMLAVFWLSVCFAAWRIDPNWFVSGPGLPIGELLFISLRFFPVPTAIGALFGYAWRGFFVGIGLSFCLLVFALIGLANSVP